MSTVLNGTYCNVPGTASYGLNLTCTGPACSSFPLMNQSLPFLCNTGSNGVVACAMNVSCATSNFTNTFRLEQNGNNVMIDNRYTLNGTWGVNGTSFEITTTVSMGNETSATSTASSGASTETAKSLAALALAGSSPGLFSSLTALGTILLFSSPVFAESFVLDHDDTLAARGIGSSVGSSWVSVPSRSQGLLFMEGDIVTSLIKNGKFCSPEQFLGGILNSFLSNAIPAPVNLGLLVQSGQYELATKSAVTTTLQSIVDATLLAGAAETGGLSLLAVFVANTLISTLVDAAFAEGDKIVAQIETPSSATSSAPSPTTTPHSGCSGTPNATDGLCNRGDYSSSPYFYQVNPFGSAEWDACNSCCVAWSDARFGGPCICCILAVQHTPNNTCCDNEPGFMDHCCSTHCGAPGS